MPPPELDHPPLAGKRQAQGESPKFPTRVLEGLLPAVSTNLKHATPLSKGLAVIRHSQLYKGM
jgi:hypothetical protein